MSSDERIRFPRRFGRDCFELERSKFFECWFEQVGQVRSMGGDDETTRRSTEMPLAGLFPNRACVFACLNSMQPDLTFAQ